MVAPLVCGPGGSCLNVNADQVAAHLAGSLKAELLVILSDLAGVCRQDGSVIPTLTLPEAQQLLAQVIMGDHSDSGAGVQRARCYMPGIVICW